MRFPSLALLFRSLRLESRSVYGHVLRLGVLVAVLLCMLEIGSSPWRAGTAGLELLTAIAWVGFLLVNGCAATLFAPCISEEREGLTLGLLRMTSLNPVSILLGKYLGRLYQTATLILVAFPLLLLCIPLGGVSLAHVGMVAVVVASTLLVASMLGLLASVLCRRSLMACVITGGLLLGLQLLLPMLLMLGATRTGGTGIWLAQAIRAYHPALVLGQLGFTPWVGEQWAAYMGVALAVALLLFLASWGIFYLFPKDGEKEARTRTRASGSRQRARVERTSRQFRRWPIAVKDFRHLAGGVRGLLWRLPTYFLVCLWILAVSRSFSTQSWSAEHWAISAWITAVVAGGVELTVMAGRFLSQESHDGTLSLLMTLPHGAAGVVWRKLAGSLWVLAGPVLMLAAGALLAPDEIELDFLEDEEFWLVAAFVVFFLHLVTYYSLWMRWGATPLAAVTVWLFGVGVALVGEGRALHRSEVVVSLVLMAASGGLALLILRRYRKLAAA